MVVAAELSVAKRRIVDRLKRVPNATAPELAAEFGLTDTAVRQHLDVLLELGFVERRFAPSSGRGRPPTHWRLSQRAAVLFADGHAELAVDLLRSMTDELGPDAVARVVDARGRRQLAAYRRDLPASASLESRVQRLAALRATEGYLAEARTDGECWELVEHHCPIRGAAEVCDALCAAELQLFRDALGPDAAVTRPHHVLAGDPHCVYTITPR